MSPFGFQERPIQITVSGQSDTGRVRSENEDYFLIADLSTAPEVGGYVQHRDSRPPAEGTCPGEFVLGPEGALALVADGMGGAAAGALASRLSAAWIYEELTARAQTARNHAPRQFALRLREVVEVANRRIYDESRHDPRYQGMGSTATVAGVLGSFLYLAQVGDSRAYLVRNGAVYQLTRDQSLVQELIEAGALTEAEAEESNKRNVILQALGTEPQIRAELTYQEIRRGDLLLLCSDGLHGVVQRAEIASIASSAAAPATICAALIDLANARGGPDNITAVAMLFEGAGLEDPRVDDIVGRQLFR